MQHLTSSTMLPIIDLNMNSTLERFSLRIAAQSRSTWITLFCLLSHILCVLVFLSLLIYISLFSHRVFFFICFLFLSFCLSFLLKWIYIFWGGDNQRISRHSLTDFLTLQKQKHKRKQKLKMNSFKTLASI